MAGAFSVSGDDSGNPKNVASPVIFDAVKKPKRNKYAFGCAILASMTSVLLGYGIYTHSVFLYCNVTDIIIRNKILKNDLNTNMNIV